MRLLWLPDVITAAGLPLVVDPGWATHGREFTQPIRWIAAHHTATPASAVGDYPSLRIVRDGRSDLPGPLSQLGLGRSGAVYLIASGRANHAGTGAWPGLSGGADSIGIEAEHPGGSALWNPDMYDAYVVLVAALDEEVERQYGKPITLGHKEWATPKGRKTDPTFDMDDFRLDVAEAQQGDVPVKPPAYATAATQWHIDTGIYTDTTVDDVDETEEFHRQSVFRHRFYTKVIAPAVGQSGASGDHSHEATVTLQ